MSAAILTIGTELTRGELVDTNATWIANRLTAIGFEVRAIETIPDAAEAITEALLRLAARHRVVVATGGLGPTTDDITAAAAARAAATTLVRDDASLEAIRRRFASMGREMSPSNEKQAYFPHGSEVLPNPVGTAPGFIVKLGGAQLFFTPGVPSEMMRMVNDCIEPRIRPLAPNNTAQNHLRTFGQGESKIGEMLAGIEAAYPGVTIGYRAHFPEIEVKIFARAKTRPEAQILADAATRQARQRLGSLVYGSGAEESFAASVARAIRKNGLTLSIAESCTGGLVGHMLTSVPGSSEFLLLDAIVYSNSSKSVVLGVDPELIRAHGAVSAECAVAMAEGARRIAGSDIAVSVTGIAGPSGGTDAKPVGLVYIGLALAVGSFVHEKRFTGDRHRVQTLAAYAALQLVVEAGNRGA